MSAILLVIGNYDLIGAVFTQIRELFQHFLGGFEVQRCLIVGIRETLSGHQNAAEGLVLGVEEVHVTGRTARFAQRIGQLQNRAVIVAQLSLRPPRCPWQS